MPLCVIVGSGRGFHSFNKSIQIPFFDWLIFTLELSKWLLTLAYAGTKLERKRTSGYGVEAIKPPHD